MTRPQRGHLTSTSVDMWPHHSFSSNPFVNDWPHECNLLFKHERPPHRNPSKREIWRKNIISLSAKRILKSHKNSHKLFPTKLQGVSKEVHYILHPSTSSMIITKFTNTVEGSLFHTYMCHDAVSMRVWANVSMTHSIIWGDYCYFVSK